MTVDYENSPECGVHIVRHGCEPAAHGEADVLQRESEGHTQLGVLQIFEINVGLQDITAVTMKMAVFWYMTPCGLVGIYYFA